MILILVILFMLPINKLSISNSRHQLLSGKRYSNTIILTFCILLLLYSNTSFHVTFLSYIRHHHTQEKGLLAISLTLKKQTYLHPTCYYFFVLKQTHIALAQTMNMVTSGMTYRNICNILSQTIQQFRSSGSTQSITLHIVRNKIGRPKNCLHYFGTESVICGTTFRSTNMQAYRILKTEEIKKRIHFKECSRKFHNTHYLLLQFIYTTCSSPIAIRSNLH